MVIALKVLNLVLVCDTYFLASLKWFAMCLLYILLVI
jgi:hypothetical protein